MMRTALRVKFPEAIWSAPVAAVEYLEAAVLFTINHASS